MDIVSRLKKYMAHVGMPTTQFADTANIARPTISQILNGRNRKISNELIAKLHEGFPNLNVMWLLFGDGEMEVKPNTQISEHQTPAIQSVSAQQQPINQQSVQQELPFFGESIPLQNSDIDEFVNESVQNQASQAQAASSVSSVAAQNVTSVDSGKRIHSIIVYYTDSSFEIFTPTKPVK